VFDPQTDPEVRAATRRYYRFVAVVVAFTAAVLICGLALLIRMGSIATDQREQNNADREANTAKILEELHPEHGKINTELREIRRELWEIETALGLTGHNR
jgi:hypothetical protein